MGQEDLPASSIALEIFALTFEKTGPDLLTSIVVSTRVVDELCRPDGHFRVNKLIASLDEGVPFMVLGHGDGSDT